MKSKGPTFAFFLLSNFRLSSRFRLSESFFFSASFRFSFSDLRARILLVSASSFDLGLFSVPFSTTFSSSDLFLLAWKAPPIRSFRFFRNGCCFFSLAGRRLPDRLVVFPRGRFLSEDLLRGAFLAELVEPTHRVWIQCRKYCTTFLSQDLENGCPKLAILIF